MDTPPARRAGRREWAGLALLTLPTLLLGLDVTVLYLALPALAEDLRPSGTQSLWIMDVYGFLIAGFLITMGTLGDRIGRRRLLMIGAVAFAAASVLAAYATSPEALIAARAALGIAGATLMPSTLALVSTMFPDPRQRALAIGVWATSFALGMVAGPLAGGLLLDRYWWGSAFLLAVPLVGVTVLAAPFLLPEYRDPRAGRLDPASVVLSLAAILPIVYAVKQSAAHGVEPLTPLVLLIGLGSGVLFVRRQHALDEPLLDMSLFASRALGAALAVLLVGLVGVGGVLFLVTQYLQLVAGLGPLAAGGWMGPPALAMLLAAIGAPLLARRVRPGQVVAGTLALSSAGYLLLALVDGADGVGAVVAGFSLVYLGLGAVAALGTDLVVGAAPPEKAGSASAMSETVQELGVAVGVAVFGPLSLAVYRARLDDQLPAGLDPGAAEAVRDGLAGAVAHQERLSAGLLDQAREAFTSGLNVSAAVAGLAILALAVLAAVTLRHVGAVGATAPVAGEEPDPVSTAPADAPERTSA
ncbi:MFS transporter [Streptomyces profundus]|uniref:MFS transporter n=1 Tax=Streptomyces profundus TaxID=2867410 RepID=UPI001D16F214|nr:MFS transporter [Streptomyces sp. MA3_2.13]UED82925.1 MFS transporter [Streptomyces sp. MA3_2.13]